MRRANTIEAPRNALLIRIRKDRSQRCERVAPLGFKNRRGIGLIGRKRWTVRHRARLERRGGRHGPRLEDRTGIRLIRRKRGTCGCRVGTQGRGVGDRIGTERGIGSGWLVLPKRRAAGDRQGAAQHDLPRAESGRGLHRRYRFVFRRPTRQTLQRRGRAGQSSRSGTNASHSARRRSPAPRARCGALSRVTRATSPRESMLREFGGGMGA